MSRAIHADGEFVDPLPETPFPTLRRWLDEARACDRIPNPDAMAVASVDEAGDPQVRIVLCRGFDPDRARFEFFTNYDSDKARQLAVHPRASCVFHWDPLGRQVRLSGRVERTSEARSDEYFASRDPLSQLSAWASQQSRTIADREALEARLDAVRSELGGGDDAPIPRPPGWGGFVVVAERIELWRAREGRLHDRAVWVCVSEDEEAREWRASRLQP